MIRLLIVALLTSTGLAGLVNWPIDGKFTDKLNLCPSDSYRTNDLPAKEDLGTTRLEIPFQFNGKALTLSVGVTYQISTHKIISTTSTVWGDMGKTVWAKLIGPTADYTGDELTVLVGMKYTAPTNENTYVAGQSGVGNVNGKKVTVTLQNEGVKPQSAYMSGILDARFDINGQTGVGRGTIRVNELSEPRYSYVIKPR